MPMELYRGRLIDHVQLVVEDLQASRSFYGAVMGVRASSCTTRPTPSSSGRTSWRFPPKIAPPRSAN